MFGRRGLVAVSVVVCSLSGSAAVWANETQDYTYDARGRLVKVQSSGTGTLNNNQVRNYCYDEAGNRVTYNANTASTQPVCVTQGTPEP